MFKPRLLASKFANSNFQNGQLVKFNTYDNIGVKDTFGIYLSPHNSIGKLSFINSHYNIIYLKHLQRASINNRLLFITNVDNEYNLEKHSTYWINSNSNNTKNLVHNMKSDIGRIFSIPYHHSLMSFNLSLTYIMCRNYNMDFERYIVGEIEESIYLSKILNQSTDRRD